MEIELDGEKVQATFVESLYAWRIEFKGAVILCRLPLRSHGVKGEQAFVQRTVGYEWGELQATKPSWVS